MMESDDGHWDGPAPDNESSAASIDGDTSHAEASDSTAAPRARGVDGLESTVIPPWDAKMSQTQIDEWAAAEARLGIKRSIQSWIKAKKKALASSLRPPQVKQPPTHLDFVGPPQRNGSLDGFVFGT